MTITLVFLRDVCMCGVFVCVCGMLICFVSTLGSHEMGHHKLPIIINIMCVWVCVILLLYCQCFYCAYVHTKIHIILSGGKEQEAEA